MNEFIKPLIILGSYYGGYFHTWLQEGELSAETEQKPAKLAEGLS